MMPFLERTCKEAARLITLRQDQPLPWIERLALRLHLAICDTCPKFEQNIRLMGAAMRQWRRYSESDPPSS
jgi:hypothetical protein